jgi:DNA repair exonuclease SbcCD ATPase subunit
MADKDTKHQRAIEFLANHGKQAELVYNSRLQLWVPSVYSLTTKYRTLKDLPGAEIVEGQRRPVLCPTLRAFVDIQYGHDDSLANSELDAAALELDWHKWLPEVEPAPAGSPTVAQSPVAAPTPSPTVSISTKACPVQSPPPLSPPAADSVPATEAFGASEASVPATEVLDAGEAVSPTSVADSPYQAELEEAKQRIANLESINHQLQDQLNLSAVREFDLARANKVLREQLQSFKEGFSDEGRLVQQVETLEQQIDTLQQQMFNTHLDSAETIHNLKSQMIDMAASHETALASLRGQLERQQQVIDTLTEGITTQQAAVKEEYHEVVKMYEKELETARTNLIDRIIELEELLEMANDEIKSLKEKHGG